MYITELLNTTHNKTEFRCGEDILDKYIRKQANQDMKRNLSACFIVNSKQDDKIKAYYTLSNTSISNNLLSEKIKKKLPSNYKSIPATLLGRLAVNNTFKAQGLGKLLLIDALKRSYQTSKQLGSFAVVVDPINQSAEQFYAKYNFIKLPDSGKMFIAMKTLKIAFGD